ncbi:Hypothetical predicted protein, partial [Olea europaea subsp. europaea]
MKVQAAVRSMAKLEARAVQLNWKVQHIDATINGSSEEGQGNVHGCAIVGEAEDAESSYINWDPVSELIGTSCKACLRRDAVLAIVMRWPNLTQFASSIEVLAFRYCFASEGNSCSYRITSPMKANPTSTLCLLENMCIEPSCPLQQLVVLVKRSLITARAGTLCLIFCSSGCRCPSGFSLEIWSTLVTPEVYLSGWCSLNSESESSLYPTFEIDHFRWLRRIVELADSSSVENQNHLKCKNMMQRRKETHGGLSNPSPKVNELVKSGKLWPNYSLLYKKENVRTL